MCNYEAKLMKLVQISQKERKKIIAWGVKDDCQTYCHEIFKFQSYVLILNSGLKMHTFLHKNAYMEFHHCNLGT